jgi:hypothetical protein
MLAKLLRVHGQRLRLMRSAQSSNRSAAATSASPSRRKSRAKSRNVFAVKVRIRSCQTGLETREADLEFVEFIALGLAALFLDGGFDGGMLGGVDAARLAVPNVECAPVREAREASGAIDRRLHFVAALPRL